MTRATAPGSRGELTWGWLLERDAPAGAAALPACFAVLVCPGHGASAAAAAARLARLAAAARTPARGGALVAAGSPFGALSPRHFAGSITAGVVANVVRAAQVRGAAA